jgi:ribosomal-protein-serine acetyltransferase
MFTRKITSEVEARLSLPYYADEIFALKEDNRNFLRQWLPWMNGTKSADDTRDFIQEQLHRFARSEALHVTIFYNGSIAGVAGFNQIDTTNGIGYIGYWLAEKYNGKGIMTQVVSDLIAIGRDELNLQKIDIRCATDNHKSRAIPERLNFSHEGTLRMAEKVYDRWMDHEIYALLLTNSEPGSVG